MESPFQQRPNDFASLLQLSRAATRRRLFFVARIQSAWGSRLAQESFLKNSSPICLQNDPLSGHFAAVCNRKSKAGKGI